MKISKVLLWLFATWGAYLIYLLSQDAASFWVSAALTPIFGVPAYRACKSRNLVLQAFAVFGFIGHAIGAPYFWMTRATASYSGFGAVKNFEFSLPELFRIYGWVASLYILIILFTLHLDRINIGGVKKIEPATSSKQVPPSHDKRSPWLLSLLILFVAVPMNFYMIRNRIGITGIVSEERAFRIVGLLYYSRLFFLPMVLTALYPRTSKGWEVSLLIAGYAVFAGFSSASRTVLLLSLMPLLLDIFLNKKRIRLIILGLFSAVAFVAVSVSRDYTYTTHSLSYSDMISTTLSLVSGSNNVTPMTLVGGIANRLYGAQDMILAYQFEPENPFASFVDYFVAGGRADSVVPNLTYDFYGLIFDEGAGFGVGIGTLAYLLILGRASIALLVLGAMVTAALLSVGGRCLAWASSFGAEDHVLPIRYFMAVILGFTLYSSSLNLAYTLMMLMIFMGIALRLARRRQRNSSMMPPPLGEPAT